MRSVLFFHHSWLFGSLRYWVSLACSPNLADFRACSALCQRRLFCIWNLHRFVDGRACAPGRNGIQAPGSCTPVCLPERHRRAAFSGWRSNDLWHALKNPDSHPPFSCRRSHDVCGILDGDFSKLSTFESGGAARLLLSSTAAIGR